MIIDYLSLEINRNCPLNCIDCFRGNSSNHQMSTDILNGIFKGIIKINYLFLTGGEPLLNVELLELVLETLKNNNVLVGSIGMFTSLAFNITDKHIEILQKLRDYCIDTFQCNALYQKYLTGEITLDETYKKNLTVGISDDEYHKNEISKLGLENIVDRNFEMLYKNGICTFFNSDFNKQEFLLPFGRAEEMVGKNSKVLTQSEVSVNYRTNRTLALPKVVGNKIIGNLCISALGFVVPASLSYIDEDIHYIVGPINSKKTLIEYVKNFREDAGYFDPSKVSITNLFITLSNPLEDGLNISFYLNNLERILSRAESIENLTITNAFDEYTLPQLRKLITLIKERKIKIRKLIFAEYKGSMTYTHREIIDEIRIAIFFIEDFEIIGNLDKTNYDAPIKEGQAIAGDLCINTKGIILTRPNGKNIGNFRTEDLYYLVELYTQWSLEIYRKRLVYSLRCLRSIKPELSKSKGPHKNGNGTN